MQRIGDQNSAAEHAKTAEKRKNARFLLEKRGIL
jgi:hypothetical protein